ncbi:MAG: DinB family protein [Planctomycetes bacterium]|nr:DinB family protein [Planctomycetota bacterium]
MNKSEIKFIYAYNKWANDLIIKTVSKLSKEQFVKEIGGSFDSLRGTLTHIASVEWLYISRWKKIYPKELWDPREFPNLVSLVEKWKKVEEERDLFIEQLTDDKLNSIIEYESMEGTAKKYILWQIMYHGVNHSTYHRGQITSFLRQLGAEPVSTDFYKYLDLK